ncbi:transcription initiation factor IIB [Halopelagius longus]|uniref:Transcription initiation factor IIB n=1 Tax=Halopelagius longus TaxID=1236180 RepID=A0A1H1GU82_9EURY|nr:transcription initiation factor IIB family protein [Halopelagius longus]RDI69558.1 transcription initiation factor IIB family protein [Halopelagius longus]SDR16764.1 Transcription initiation factor IIB (TFIIB) [Halopelagius longus]
MATRDIYESGFDEERSNSTTSACPECGGHVRTNCAETVCEDCGLIIDELQIDRGPDWRSVFDDDDETQRRTGAPLTPARHDRGLSTEIGYERDARGNTLSGEKRGQIARLRREQSRGRFQSKAERNLAHGLTEVRRIASALGLSETARDRACALFRSAQDEDLLYGRSIEAMAAASVYGACRCTGLSRTLDEVITVARVSKRRVSNAYKALNSELGLPTAPLTPQSFVSRLASDLEVTDHVRHRAFELAERAEAETIANGRQPSGVAAACLYLAAQERDCALTQASIAKAAGTTPVTLRSRRDELQRELSQ